jgi:hypothetical protein
MVPCPSDKIGGQISADNQHHLSTPRSISANPSSAELRGKLKSGRLFGSAVTTSGRKRSFVLIVRFESAG